MSTPTSEFVQRLIATGYPESVARRIASGELPMDYASRMQRAAKQGYDPRTYYHGGAPNLLSIDPTVSSSRKTEGTGTWFSDMPEVANSYLSKDSQLYPVRINTQGMDMIDAEGAGWASLPSKNLMRDGKQKYPYPDDHTLSSDVMANMAREGGRAGLVIDNVVDLGPNVRMPKQINDDWRQWLLDYEQKGGRSVSVQDPNRVRSVNAAFDPEYVGPNILGNADPRLLAGLVGAGLLGAAVAPKAKSEEAKTKEVDPFAQALMDYTSDANFLPSPSERLIPISSLPAEMRANNPDLIRDITNLAGDAMGGDYYDYRAAEGLMNVADFMPYIGGGISMQQGADAYRNNRKWEGRLLTGLGLLEVIPYLGKMASESIVPAVRPTMKRWDESDSLLRLLEQQ